MRTPLVIGNWKMNGDAALISAHRDRLQALGERASRAVLCPPFVYLSDAKALLKGSPVAYGAQDVSNESQGAFTGQISAEMLHDMGCKYVIIGHSERRALCAETNELVAAKFAQAQAQGLIPVLCVGETAFQRDHNQTEAVILDQLKAVVTEVGIAAFQQAVVAYEPVWAIGSGEPATPEQAQAVHAMIRQWFSRQDAAVAQGLRILYGGSVKEDNAQALFSQTDIDGGLIGGASLKVEAFANIVQAIG